VLVFHSIPKCVQARGVAEVRLTVDLGVAGSLGPAFVVVGGAGFNGPVTPIPSPGFFEKSYSVAQGGGALFFSLFSIPFSPTVSQAFLCWSHSLSCWCRRIVWAL